MKEYEAPSYSLAGSIRHSAVSHGSSAAVAGGIMQAMKVKERDINAGIRQLLQLDGWHVLMMETVWSREYRKGTGEVGMPDMLAIRYLPTASVRSFAEVLWIEGKTPKGRTGVHQLAWHAVERGRGALVWRAGADFEASVEGFRKHYEQSGLCRRKLE